MKKTLSLLLAGVSLLSCLTGCSKDAELVGIWEDDSGYSIEFDSNGTFVESDYGKTLQYTYSNGDLVYTWPDGYTRTTVVTFLDGKGLSLKINGQDRTFYPSKTKVRSSGWQAEQLTGNMDLASKFVLQTSLPVQSELRLLANKSYSLSWGKELPSDWTLAGENVQLGMYADCGAGEALILYAPDVSCCDLLIESPEGTYLGAMSLTGSLYNVQADFASPVDWRGYTMSGTLEEASSGIKYVFSEDNSMRKIASDGTELSYAYFIDREGLVNLYCIDGFLDTDYMWLDVEGKTLYRLAFKRDSWTDYMYTIAKADKLSDSTEGENVAPETAKYTAQDAEQITGDGISLSSLLAEKGDLVSVIYSAISDIEYDEFRTDYLSVSAQTENLAGSLEEQRLLEEQRQEQKDKFLAQMAGLAEERKQKEQEAADLFGMEMEALGYKYDDVTDTWYIPGSVDYYPDGYTPDAENPNAGASSSGDIPSNFGGSTTPEETPIVPGSISNYSSATVTFACNCLLCRTEHTPLAEGEDNIVLADTSVWPEGAELLIGSSDNIDVTVADGKGVVKGKNLVVYSTDHAWINAQHDGIYTVREVKG